jgi:hypothetical protein
VSDPPLTASPLVGGPRVDRRSVLRLLSVAAVGVLAGCRSGKQRTAPTSPGPSTAPTGSRQPAPTSTPPLTGSASPQPTVSALSADQLLAAQVAAAEQALLAAYDAVAVAHPELAGRLAPFRADHAAHLAGLVPGATPSTSPPSPTAQSSTVTSSAVPASAVPPSAVPSSAASASAPLSSPPASTAILRQLADLERSAAAARIDDAVTTSGSLARLVASIGGCEAAHAALLSVAT